MSENFSPELLQTPMLFQKALEKCNGPIDADHVAYVIMLATADDSVDAMQEQIEYDYLLILLIHEIRHKKPMLRSFENVFELLNQNDIVAVESILKISEYWKKASDDKERLHALSGVKARLLQVILADDPAFAIE